MAVWALNELKRVPEWVRRERLWSQTGCCTVVYGHVLYALREANMYI